MSGYRDKKGQFLPDHINAEEAKDKGVADKFGISKNYQGKEENAVGRRIEPNPYQFHHKVAPPAEQHTKTGQKPTFHSVESHFKGKK